jgi:tartrate-resistant acid phosphatase type 5
MKKSLLIFSVIVVLAPGLLVCRSSTTDPATPTPTPILTPTPTVTKATDTLGIRLPLRPQTFLVFGDWGQAGSTTQLPVAAQMDRYAGALKADGMIVTGDNFYPLGVSSVTDPQWQTAFEQVYTGKNLPPSFYVVLGNHDYGLSPQAEIDYGKTHPRWVMPSRYYTRTFAVNGKNDLRVIFMDTSPYVVEYQQAGTYADLNQQNPVRQTAWLDSVLRVSTEPWKIVVGHHPFYSFSTAHGGQAELVQAVRPLFEKYGVQLYMDGHNHDLEYIKPAGKTYYMVSGGGGALTTNISPYVNGDLLFGKGTAGFSVVSVGSDSLHVAFIDAQGKVLYQHRLGK